MSNRATINLLPKGNLLDAISRRLRGNQFKVEILASIIDVMEEKDDDIKRLRKQIAQYRAGVRYRNGLKEKVKKSPTT